MNLGESLNTSSLQGRASLMVRVETASHAPEEKRHGKPQAASVSSSAGPSRHAGKNSKKSAGDLRLMIEILHDLTYQNPRT